jgi:hypothetical protein
MASHVQYTFEINLPLKNLAEIIDTNFANGADSGG